MTTGPSFCKAAMKPASQKISQRVTASCRQVADGDQTGLCSALRALAQEHHVISGRDSGGGVQGGLEVACTSRKGMHGPSSFLCKLRTGPWLALASPRAFQSIWEGKVTLSWKGLKEREPGLNKARQRGFHSILARLPSWKKAGKRRQRSLA